MHQSKSWIISLYGPYKTMFSIVPIHHLDCGKSQARFPPCSFGVSSKGAFSRSLNFNRRRLLHGQVVVSCKVFTVNNSRYIKMSHWYYNYPRISQVCDFLIWALRGKTKQTNKNYYFHYVATDQQMSGRVQKVFKEKVNSVNPLIHAPSSLFPPTTLESVNHPELNEVRKIWWEMS